MSEFTGPRDEARERLGRFAPCQIAFFTMSEFGTRSQYVEPLTPAE
jgi:hypothetical protein